MTANLFSMKGLTAALVIGTSLMYSQQAGSVDSIVIESKAVAPGSSAESTGVYISNDQTLQGFVLPLVVRQVDPGSFVADHLSLGISGRLQSLQPYGFLGYVRRYTMDGVFPGSRTSCPLDSLGHTWNPTDSVAAVDLVSPEGLLYAFVQNNDTAVFIGGADSIPSLLMNFGTTLAQGSFEIDTTCVPPFNHVLFIAESWETIVPQFQKAVIDIGGPFWSGDSLSGAITQDLVLRRDVLIDGDLVVNWSGPDFVDTRL